MNAIVIPMHCPVMAKIDYQIKSISPLSKSRKLLLPLLASPSLEESDGVEGTGDSAGEAGDVQALGAPHCERTGCPVDRFTKELFWNFKKCRAVSMEAYPYKQMSEKKFFPNVAPSPGSGPLLLAGAVAVQGVGGRGWRLPIGRELKIEASHWSRGPQEKNLRL